MLDFWTRADDMWNPSNSAPQPHVLLKDLRAGGCAVWGLPPDETCSRAARSLLRAALRGLHIGANTIDDAETIVSEIATNTFVHALGGRRPEVLPDAGLPELLMYRRGTRPEIVTKVFDSAPWKGDIPAGSLRPSLAAENGRGFELIHALTAEHHGHWGVHRTRSRLGVPVSGKAVYFTIPLPAAGPPAQCSSQVQGSCRNAAQALQAALAARGLGTRHRCDGWDMAVLSVRAEITVWVHSGMFLLTTPHTGTVRYPLTEVTELTEVIVQCNEDLHASSG